jgi:hypothetical protein
VEFYGKFDGSSLHLVALDYDMDNKDIRLFIRERVEQYTEYTRKCVAFGIDQGIIDGITWDDIVAFSGDGAWICIDSVMNTYREKRIPIPENLRAAVFKSPEMLEQKPHSPSAECVIKAIRKAGGIAVLAHPNNLTHLVPKLVEFGLNGIETSHPHLRDDTRYLALEAADIYNLYRSGGTDHTGPMSGCDGKNAVSTFDGISYEEYTIIKERKLG